MLSKSVDEARSQSAVLSLAYVGLGVAMGIAVFLQVPILGSSFIFVALYNTLSAL